MTTAASAGASSQLYGMRRTRLQLVAEFEQYRPSLSLESNMKIDILSGIQPTGDLHLGNYFGAVANWVELQEKYSCAYVVVDYHTLTMGVDAKSLRQRTRQMFVDLLACGIDPDKSILFVQSAVPEHTELFWILSCHCSFGELSRMTQFKDKSDDTDFISAGLFAYPVLQAADILAYRARFVPVGKDQEQHLELARSIVKRFNKCVRKNLFRPPQPLFTKTPKIMSLSDPSRKMSKSAGEKHYIGLFEDEKSIRKKVKSAVTDSGPQEDDGTVSPGVANLLEILSAAGQSDMASEFEGAYRERQLKYAVLKDSTADAIVALRNRLNSKREELIKDTSYVDSIMDEMGEKARALARETVGTVREAIGLPTKEASSSPIEVPAKTG